MRKRTPSKRIYNSDGTVVVLTKNNDKVLMDLEDCDLFCNGSVCLNGGGYATIYDPVNKKPASLHRLIANTPDDMHTDHINRNKLDNRRCNLRICTCQENHMNESLSKKNTSGCVGVSWCKREARWRAFIKLNNKMKSLGYYFNKIDAVSARKIAESEYFDSFRNRRIK